MSEHIWELAEKNKLVLKGTGYVVSYMEGRGFQAWGDDMKTRINGPMATIEMAKRVAEMEHEQWASKYVKEGLKELGMEV